MNKKSFSYAEAMVTMLIVAIIMVATTPILSQRRNVNKSTIWSWAADNDGAATASTFFGTGATQRVIIGSNSLVAGEKARLVVYQPVVDNTNNPIISFYNASSNDIGRLITNDSNVGLGKRVLNANSSTSNTAVGVDALYQSTGGRNTAFGFNACSAVTSGAGNVCIGANAGPEAGNAATSNKLYINNTQSDTPLIEGNFADGSKSVTINGRLLVNAGGGGSVDILNAINNIVSDSRLKNISGLSSAGLEKINKIVVKNYTFKNDKNKNPHVGVIAQELQKVFPNSVKKGEDGYLRINKDEMFYAMINSIKQLDAKFSKNDTKMQKMEQEIEDLRQQNAILTKKITEIEQKLQKK